MNERKARKMERKTAALSFLLLIFVYGKKCYQENIYMMFLYTEKDVLNFNPNCLYYTKRGFTLCYIMLFHIFCSVVLFHLVYIIAKEMLSASIVYLLKRTFSSFLLCFFFIYIYFCAVSGSWVFLCLCKDINKKKHLANCIYNKYIQSFVY